MRLRIQTFANNEVRISRQSDLIDPPLRGDTAKEKRLLRYGQALVQNANINTAIKHLLENHPRVEKVVHPTFVQLSLFGDDIVVGRQNNEYKLLPHSYKVVNTLPDGRLYVKEAPTDNLLKEFGRTLDIISESQRSPKKHSMYGMTQKPKVFSKLARHRLLEAGAVVDKLGLKDSSSLLTLTLPGGTPEAKDALARWSGWIVNRQTQFLRRDKRLKNCHWFFVWEWQKRGALHQHWCVSADTYELAQLATLAMKDAWYKCLDEISMKEGIDMYLKEGGSNSWKHSPDKWVWNEQKVKKDVGRYFAKYASKEVAYTKEQQKTCKRKVYFPSRWFGSSANIKKACKAYRMDFSLHRINPLEAEVLRHELLEILSNAGITQQYEYQFEARSKTSETVFCYGTTEVLYVTPSKFDGVVSTIKRLFSKAGSGVFASAPIQWSLHLARQVKNDDTLPGLKLDRDYGRHILYR